jgi:hypothetical protein
MNCDMARIVILREHHPWLPLSPSASPEAKLTDGLSNDAIADKAGYSEKTIRDVIKGRCLVYETVKDVCSVLDIDLDPVLVRTGLDVSTEGNAPAHLGGYAKENYLDLIGSYTTVRPIITLPILGAIARNLIGTLGPPAFALRNSTAQTQIAKRGMSTFPERQRLCTC